MSESKTRTFSVSEETVFMARTFKFGVFLGLILYGFRIFDAGNHALEVLFSDVSSAVEVCQSCYRMIAG